MTFDKLGTRALTYAAAALLVLVVWYLLVPTGCGVAEIYGWVWGGNLQTWEDMHLNGVGKPVWTMYGSWPHWAQRYPLGGVLTLLPIVLGIDTAAVITWQAMKKGAKKLSRRSAVA